MLPPGRVRMLAGDGRGGPRGSSPGLSRRGAWRCCCVLRADARRARRRADRPVCRGGAERRASRPLRRRQAARADRTGARRSRAARPYARADPRRCDRARRGPRLPRPGRDRRDQPARRRADPGCLTRRVEDQRRDALAARHAHLAQFAPRVLAGLDLRAAPGDQPLLDAIRYIDVNRERQLLPDAPLRFCRRPTGLGSAMSAAGSCVLVTSSRCGSSRATRCAPGGVPGGQSPLR